MRVLHVVPRIAPEYGGPSVALPGLARELVKFGIDITLLSTNLKPDGRLGVLLNQPVIQDGVEYIFHDVRKGGGRYGVAPSAWQGLHRIMPRYDLVHIHGLYDFVCTAAARAAIGARVPFVIQPMGSLNPHLLKKNRLLKRAYLATVGHPLLTRAAAVVFTSEQERALASYGRRLREWIVPVGLDAATFENIPGPGVFRAAFPQVDGPFLLFVGRLSKQKGLDLLLGAFARVARENPKHWLVLAGPDPDGLSADLRAMSERLGIGPRILFTGLLSHELKLAAFVDADLFVLPSYAENFGAVITEALACGLPVVMSNQVDIHHEMAAAGVATVVDCTVDSVAAGITSALSDSDMRRRIATRGPAVVQAHYTWEAIVPLLISKYREVADLHG